MTATRKKILAPDYTLDSGIAVTECGLLLIAEGAGWRDVSKDPTLARLTIDPARSVPQLTAYGKVEFFHTPASNVIARQYRDADKQTRWVPLTGRKPTRPRKEKVDAAHRKGEALFDPNAFLER
jgi:hypothetical protein